MAKTDTDVHAAALRRAQLLERPARARRKRSRYVRVTLVYLAVGTVVILIVLPLWSMAVASVSPLSFLYSDHLPLWPPSLRFSNFVEAWHSGPFGRYYFNSIVTTVAIVALQLTTSSLAAYALVFTRFRSSKIVLGLVLLAMFVPTQAVFVSSYILMSDYGWINSYQALIMPFGASAFGIFFLTQSFKSFPHEVIESGRVDGCTHLRSLFSLVLPNMRPAIATLAVINGVFHFNYFFWPLVITNSPHYRVLPVGLTTMASQSGGDQLIPWNQVMAADMFMIVPLIAVFAATQRVMVRGVARVGLR
jgi:ABC-type glycerol-3-phosphate transport system permease component